MIMADTGWCGKALQTGHEIAVSRPSLVKRSALEATCSAAAYTADPEDHKWCCKPHTVAEAEWSDLLAQRRARGELNPEVWPPLVDEERFDVGPATDSPTDPHTPVPTGLTLDDLD